MSGFKVGDKINILEDRDAFTSGPAIITEIDPYSTYPIKARILTGFYTNSIFGYPMERIEKVLDPIKLKLTTRKFRIYE